MFLLVQSTSQTTTTQPTSIESQVLSIKLQSSKY